MWCWRHKMTDATMKNATADLQTGHQSPILFQPIFKQQFVQLVWSLQLAQHLGQPESIPNLPSFLPSLKLDWSLEESQRIYKHLKECWRTPANAEQILQDISQSSQSPNTGKFLNENVKTESINKNITRIPTQSIKFEIQLKWSVQTTAPTNS